MFQEAQPKDIYPGKLIWLEYIFLIFFHIL